MRSTAGTRQSKEVIDMNEWTVVTVIIGLVGLIVTVMAPILKFNNTVSRLSTLIEGIFENIKRLEEENAAFREHASESHLRLHERIDGNEQRLQNHEIRIVKLETRDEKEMTAEK